MHSITACSIVCRRLLYLRCSCRIADIGAAKLNTYEHWAAGARVVSKSGSRVRLIRKTSLPRPMSLNS